MVDVPWVQRLTPFEEQSEGLLSFAKPTSKMNSRRTQILPKISVFYFQSSDQLVK